MLYAKQPLENQRGPTPDKSPIDIKNNSNLPSEMKYNEID
jgi:hypothetical protein